MRDSILRMTLATVALGMLSTGMLMAQVVGNSDPILRNSACVGFDCPDNPSFSDTTILMMENNTRIKFDDTSSIGGFPNRDWSLNANDSASGGANRFWIQDCGSSSQGGCSGNAVFSIAAGARNNALFVNSSGRLGLGTSTPVVDIHAVNGNTPALRLEQNTSSGFAAQTWDIAGNETNFFVRDVTGGSALPFRIQPGAPSNSIFTATGGNVGLGTSSPAESLHVRRASGAGSVRLLTESSDNGAVQWLMKTNSANRRFLAQNGSGTNQAQIVFGDNGAFQFLGPTGADVRMNIDSSGNVTIQGTCENQGGGGAPDGCDFVFDPAYQLESIEEHAAFMWQNSHLPAIGPTPEGKTVSLSLQQRHFGMLNELEKAHIYIERLNERLKEKENEVERLGMLMEQKDAQLSQILDRLEKVESAIH